MNELNNEKFSSTADIQNSAFEQQPNNADKYKQMAVNDINTIQNFVKSGLMTQEQGQNLMNYVTQKAFEKYTTSQTPAFTNTKISVQKQEPPTMPDFFNQTGRIDVYDYLKNSNADFDEDEISRISALVEKIENTAIQRYLEKQEHEKALNNENESAKQRLRANAQNTSSDGLKNLVFTREQIGKMSGAEFAKHERAIMNQLKNGLIK